VFERELAEFDRAYESRDQAALPSANSALWEAAQGADPEALSGVLRHICGWIPRTGLGIAGRLAVLAGALVEDGADPDGFDQLAVAGCGTSLDIAAELVTTWLDVVGERSLPDPAGGQADFDRAMRLLTQPRRWTKEAAAARGRGRCPRKRRTGWWRPGTA
jgi:hypothetical protein